MTVLPRLLPDRSIRFYICEFKESFDQDASKKFPHAKNLFIKGVTQTVEGEGEKRTYNIMLDITDICPPGISLEKRPAGNRYENGRGHASNSHRSAAYDPVCDYPGMPVDDGYSDFAESREDRRKWDPKYQEYVQQKLEEIECRKREEALIDREYEQYREEKKRSLEKRGLASPSETRYRTTRGGNPTRYDSYD